VFSNGQTGWVRGVGDGFGFRWLVNQQVETKPLEKKVPPLPTFEGICGGCELRGYLGKEAELEG